LLKIIAKAVTKGPIGILGHTNDDAEERLLDNLDGFNWLVPQLGGKPPGSKPKRNDVRGVPSQVHRVGSPRGSRVRSRGSPSR